MLLFTYRHILRFTFSVCHMSVSPAVWGVLVSLRLGASSEKTMVRLIVLSSMAGSSPSFIRSSAWYYYTMIHDRGFYRSTCYDIPHATALLRKNLIYVPERGRERETRTTEFTTTSGVDDLLNMLKVVCNNSLWSRLLSFSTIDGINSTNISRTCMYR